MLTNTDIHRIIMESIEDFINESFIDEKNDIKTDIENFLAKNLRTKKKRKSSLKARKRAKGGSEYYDYLDYVRKNAKISLGDAKSIMDVIDMEKTNIAAIARIIFPHHTDEGAQSQLRKILKGERPMTKPVAMKIVKLINGRKIVVK